jgi:hypothetical protein
MGHGLVIEFHFNGFAVNSVSYDASRSAPVYKIYAGRVLHFYSIAEIHFTPVSSSCCPGVALTR